jgi:hypothetical protein
MLKKINFKLRKFHMDVELFNLYLNNNYEGWGFDILKITKNLRSYSLFKISVLLPNGAERRTLHWDADILFLRTPSVSTLVDLEDKKLWTPRSMTSLDKFKLFILSKIFY